MSGFGLLAAKQRLNDNSAQDSVIAAQIQSNDSSIDGNLSKMESHFGKEYLDGLSERELYSLYKSFLAKE